MAELTPSALAVLKDAGDDGFLFCNSGGVKGGPGIQVRKGLASRSLIEWTDPCGKGDMFTDDFKPVDQNNAGPGRALRITDAGREAAGLPAVETPATPNDDDGGLPADPVTDASTGVTDLMPAPAADRTARTPRENSKKAQLITALSDSNGATVDELQKRFGWQAHTVRGAMSTLKANGLGNVTNEKVEGRGRVYRLAVA